jgi:hypothetical protein
MSPYSKGLSANNLASDSVTVLKILNYEAGVRWQFYRNKVVYSFSLGFKNVKERLQYNHNYYLNSIDNSGVYDSLLLQSEYTIDNYYNYFNISLGTGYYWDLHKFGFSLNGCLTVGILSGNSDYVANTDAVVLQLRLESINKTQFSVGVQPDLMYKIAPKINLHLTLNYTYNLNNSKSYPMNYLHTVGVSSGFSIFL